MRRLRGKVLLASAAGVLAMSVGAGAAPAPAHPPVLHAGSHGARVAELQKLLAGHGGYVFTAVKPTFPHDPNGLFGDRTAGAVKAMKFRLGYPSDLVQPIAGPYLFALLTGHKTRPAAWVAIAAARLRAVEASTPTPLALHWKAVLVSWLGLQEQPLGSNRGPCISTGCVWHGHSYPALQASTGAYGAAWCVSTQQQAGALAGYGHFADDTASVYYAADWFAARNMLHAKPRFGALVLFVDYDAGGHRIPGTGHMGWVTKVGAGWFVSIEGNQANGVHEVFHHIGDRGDVFAYIPTVTTPS